MHGSEMQLNLFEQFCLHFILILKKGVICELCHYKSSSKFHSWLLVMIMLCFELLLLMIYKLKLTVIFSSGSAYVPL